MHFTVHIIVKDVVTFKFFIYGLLYCASFFACFLCSLFEDEEKYCKHLLKKKIKIFFLLMGSADAEPVIFCM